MRSGIRLPALAVAMTVAMTVAACGTTDLSFPADTGSFGLSSPTPVDPDESDATAAAAIADVEAYWEDVLPDLYGIDLEPLTGGYLPYGPDGDLPECGPEDLTYDDLEANALYCGETDQISWDRVELMPDLQSRYGPLTVAIVIAHEFGHAIQDRVGTSGLTVTLELQADCFAGAWVADAHDRDPRFSIDGNALDLAVGGFLELRDAVGTGASDVEAHGSGFDRISAFQDGFDGGADACQRYDDDPPRVVALSFEFAEDAARGGDLPFDELLEPLVADLDTFFATLFAEEGEIWLPVRGVRPIEEADEDRCDISDAERLAGSLFCAPDNIVYLDTDVVEDELSPIGDFAVAAEIARRYAQSSTHQLEVPIEDADAHADCVTGVFVAAQYLGAIPDQQLVLSPGDIDEIIIAFLARSQGSASAFDRTASFRSGFFSGFDTCTERFG